MKRIIAVTAMLIALGVSTLAYAQTFTSDWTLYKEVDGVKISMKLVECDRNQGYDEKMVFIKIENTNDQTAKVHYHLDQYYDNQCKTCDDPYGEYTADIGVGPNSTIEGSCSYTEKGLSAFAGWADKDKSNELLISKIELSELEVSLEEEKNVSEEHPENSNPNPPDHIKNDPEKYKEWKENWIKEHPEEYKKMTNQEDKHVISKSEFENMPEDKRQHILNNPDKYIIK